MLYPDQFCPECDERMFFDAQSSQYSCPNCGHQSAITIKGTTTRQFVQPQNSKPLPKGVENLIKESEGVGRVTRKNSLGDQIRKLVDNRDTGDSVAPTPEDDIRVKNSDKNVSNKINWI
jgi:predicted RNA-binding Zn-ribbon protein involved in translation (DUF1610 family)